jgi:phosphatidylglycerophosphate synthase
MNPTAPGLPPFAQVLKSRDVEDPINLWVHRPLAYAFCWLIYGTRITPNQVTLFAILLGLGASAAWIDGQPWSMVLGGALLWSSAIMDGADGILARAKNLQSAFGRALDGTGDMLVGLASVVGCVYHLIDQGASAPLIAVCAFVFPVTILQFNLYDFYKELHMRQTRLDRGGESDTASEAEVLRRTEKVKQSPWYTRLSMTLYADYLRTQEKLIRATNPHANQLLSGVTRSAESAELYRRLNRGPMRLWMAVSLAPHSYLFAIFGMFDRLGLYIVLRGIVMSMVMAFAVVQQRQSTERTLAEFRERSWLGAGA